jgi:dGTPase
MRVKSQALKKFLFNHLYRHPQVVDTTGQAAQMVKALFSAYLARPQEMQERFLARSEAARDAANVASGTARVVADYIAGMTDRFAGREHERLTGLRLL